MAPTLRPSAILLFIALSSVAAQTFQYSRGWTNGKRDGNRRPEAGAREMAISPCELAKLRRVLEGKPLTDRLLEPCAGAMEDSEAIMKPHYLNDRPSDPFVEAYL